MRGQNMDDYKKHLSMERQFKLQTIFSDIDNAQDISILKTLTKELALQLLLTQQFVSDTLVGSTIEARFDRDSV